MTIVFWGTCLEQYPVLSWLLAFLIILIIYLLLNNKQKKDILSSNCWQTVIEELPYDRGKMCLDLKMYGRV